MRSALKKNRTSFYRRLKGMTQAEAAEILNTCKSNIANMESENHFPSEAYRKLLNIAPRELTAPLMPTEKYLRARNLYHLFVGGSEEELSYENPSCEDILKAFPDFSVFKVKNSKFHLEIKGEYNETAVYAWKSDFDFPAISVKKGDVLPVIPRLAYKDGAIILHRPTNNKLNVAILSENGTCLLAASENEENPDICLVEIIGEIITK